MTRNVLKIELAPLAMRTGPFLNRSKTDGLGDRAQAQNIAACNEYTYKAPRGESACGKRRTLVSASRLVREGLLFFQPCEVFREVLASFSTETFGVGRTFV